MASLLEKLHEWPCTVRPRYLHTGITHLERGYMLYLMRQWPERSGHIDWPVPASRTDTSPKSAKHKYMVNNTEQMWDKGQEYGQLRWELLEWLIEELQK